jgi:transposase-like protein
VSEYFKHRRLGGKSRTVEIDESLLHRRKYHRGRKKPSVWVFGIAQRKSVTEKKSTIVLQYVKDRTKHTLLPIIKDRCLTQTTIMSDEWAAFKKLNLIGERKFKHLSVCHNKWFKDPNTGGCTNSIEGGWKHMRSWFPKGGLRENERPDYLYAFQALYNEEMKFSDFIWVMQE